MIINHNLSAAYSSRVLNERNDLVQKNIESLSSGQRINRGGDDPSGLAVSEKLRSQVRGLNQASANIQNGVSFIQTTEGYLQNTQDVIQRVRELAVQSANGIYTEEDRSQIQVEVSQLVDEVNRIANHSQFNGLTLLTGRFAAPSQGTPADPANVLKFQVGANMDQSVRVFVGNLGSKALGLADTQGQALSLSTPDSANKAIGTLDAALRVVSKQRADLGAYQNRFEFAHKGVDNASENLQASESRIRDTDMAAKAVDFVKNQILTSAATAMLTQSNTQTQSVLKLLG